MTQKVQWGDYKFDKDMKTLTITQTDLIMKLAKDMKLTDTKTPGTSNVMQEKYSSEFKTLPTKIQSYSLHH